MLNIPRAASAGCAVLVAIGLAITFGCGPAGDKKTPDKEASQPPATQSGQAEAGAPKLAPGVGDASHGGQSEEPPAASTNGGTTPATDAPPEGPALVPAHPVVGGKKAELLVDLPTDLCNTPDGMCLLPDGNVILSVPNFNDQTQKPFLARITQDNKFEVFFKLDDNPDTGKPFGPLGVCVEPSGNLLVADYQATGDRKSRVVRIVVKDGKPVEAVPVITGFHVSNAVIIRDGHLYVSETQIDPKAKPATSGVFRFKLEELDGDKPVVLVEDEANDPHLLGILETNDELPLGADGLCFDKQGNLYVGNFAGATVHKFTFDDQGNVTSNSVFAKADFMKSCDGLFFDPVEEVIYVADSRANAVQVVALDGSVSTLASNGDTDGSDGGMDQPCEVLLRGRELIVSNMDWPVPGCINQTVNKPCTLSVIRLGE